MWIFFKSLPSPLRDPYVINESPSPVVGFCNRAAYPVTEIGYAVVLNGVTVYSLPVKREFMWTTYLLTGLELSPFPDGTRVSDRKRFLVMKNDTAQSPDSPEFP